MKKIDLHIHTVPTDWDSDFNFNLENLNKYVSEAKLDAIAITNHNMFDGDQFRAIDKTLGVVVFPGIEVSLDCGHILIISDTTDLEDFAKQNLFYPIGIQDEELFWERSNEGTPNGGWGLFYLYTFFAWRDIINREKEAVIS